MHDTFILQGVKESLAAQGLPVVPMTVFAKGAHYALESLSNTPYDVVGLDWTIDPTDAIKRTGGRVTLQGIYIYPCFWVRQIVLISNNISFGPDRQYGPLRFVCER